ncbi:EamA family transporter [Timonella sp. A28]|uniref:EamA family transporter n=1 Tax=Timonella sp. A28 TaxID=3442640 RepID=UPI003EBD7346
MEETRRWSLVAAFAPITWGAAYYVTKAFLPEDAPLWGAVLRALPAGIILLLWARKLPSGSWWWRSLLLGTLNMGVFFLLVYVAAQLLPSGTAATIMALSPLVMMLVGWLLLSDRPRALPLLGAAFGFFGVFLMVTTGTGRINLLGILASATAMLVTSFGYILTKKWTSKGDAPPVLAATSWQLTAGGLMLIPFALLFEGTPPALNASELLGFGYLSVIATAVAYLAWFTGLKHLSPGTIGLVGLLNPVTGVVVGAMLGGESLTALQIVGIVVVLVGVLLGQRQTISTTTPTIQGVSENSVHRK